MFINLMLNRKSFKLGILFIFVD